MEFPQHSQRLLSGLHFQRQHGILCDCTVLVGTSSFVAHQAVLASCSPFFYMFYSGYPRNNSASTSCSITLDSDIVTAGAFSLLLDFVYEGVLKVAESTPDEDILAAASFLHMSEVVIVCKQRLQRRGPVADDTCSEDSTMVTKALGIGREEEGDGTGHGTVQMLDPIKVSAPATSVSLTADMTQLDPVLEQTSDESMSEGQAEAPLSPDIADTTQPDMDVSYVPPNNYPLSIGSDPCVSENQLRSVGPDEAPCSPCSTETYR